LWLRRMLRENNTSEQTESLVTASLRVCRHHL
jgi:hypothetical protein